MTKKIDNKAKKELKKKGQKIKASIIIGKDGLTISSIKEIRNQMKKKRLLKIKVLRSYLDQFSLKDTEKNITESIPEVAIVEKRGHTILIYKVC